MIEWYQGAVKLRYAVEGAGGASVILLHELGGSLESWDGVVEQLKDRYRLLRYDLRGAGQSETPPQPFTVDDWVADLRELIAVTQLPPPYHLVGGAVGALIAVSFALQYPQEVASVTLLAPALGVSDPARRQEMTDRTNTAMQKGIAVVADAALAKSYPEAVRHDKARFERFRQTMINSDPRGWAYCNYALMNAQVEHRLGELRPPVQFLAGSLDPLRMPAIVKALAAKAAAARFEEIESGHFMHVQTPALVADKIKGWVDGHSA